MQGKLLLENGQAFEGELCAEASGPFFGEIVFTTSMTGYVETLTDPSFAGQILVFTYPSIGNYGVPSAHVFQSSKIQVRAVVLNQLCESSPAHIDSLRTWLKKEKIPVLTGVDTRALTQTLRDSGTLHGAIVESNAATIVDFKAFSTNDRHIFPLPSKIRRIPGQAAQKLLIVDCGMKQSLLAALAQFPWKIEIVPFDDAFEKRDFDAIFLSNGPGDPNDYHQTIDRLRQVLTMNKPIFGVCLGVQLLALAIGARVIRLPFGHRGQNHPCQETQTKRAYLTAQNHGYAIEESSLPQDWIVTFRHLNDQTVAGISHQSKPYSGVQFHPEGAPGPRDTLFLFERFYEKV